MSRTLYFVAYDVRHPTRLRKALRVLKDYASGGQKSAFECYLSAGEKNELLERICDVLDLTIDAFVLPAESIINDIPTGISPVFADRDFSFRSISNGSIFRPPQC